MRWLSIISISFLALVGCTKDPYANLDTPKQFFAEHRIGSAPDYAIIKFGNPRDHVATVHGFADDGGSCREIADALNVNACRETDGQDCLNPYSCEALN